MSRTIHPARRIEGIADGPTLILVNSLATTIELWDGFVPFVAKRYRVVRYDLPGHGRSSRLRPPRSIRELGRGVLAVLDALGLKRACVCGVSIGGMAAMWAASEAPDRIERLVVCSAGAVTGSPAFWTERADVVRRGGLAAIESLLLERWLTDEMRRGTDARIATTRDMIHATDPDAYVAYCGILGETDLTPRLRSIVSPTLIVTGAEDPTIGPSHAAALTQGIRSSVVESIPGASHLVPLEQPERLTAAINRNFEGVA